MATVAEDGSIQLLGRGSVCINTGGEKVYPEEVESVLKDHPGVYDVVVVGVPHERWGEQVTAVMQPAPGVEIPEGDALVESLAAHCRGRLAGYKAPKAVTVVDEIKRSPAGKADYRWAKDVVGAPSPAASLTAQGELRLCVTGVVGDRRLVRLRSREFVVVGWVKGRLLPR